MDYKSFFDIPEEILYLNTAGNGLLPRRHQAWRRQRDTEFFDAASPLRDQQPELIHETKTLMGRLFHCPVDNCYAVPNFSFGYNTLLAGLPTDYRYAVLENDYPSVYYPIVSRRLAHTVVPVGEYVEDNIRATIRAERPQVFVFSVVDYITGLKIDLEFIRALKADFPDLLIVGDATQYLGTEPFDFEASGFDAIVASGYKWLLAGYGNGVVFLSNRMQQELYADAQRGARPKEAMWDSKSILATFLEPGHQDTLSHGTLAQSALFFEKLGLENIQRHIQATTAYAYDVFAERQWMLPWMAKRKVQSPLINLQIDPSLYPALTEAGVKCFPRGTGIRVALHLYNDRQDVARLVEVIDKQL